MKKKNWCHKYFINTATLERELNAFSEQGYEIYKLWKVGNDDYEIVAYKEE